MSDNKAQIVAFCCNYTTTVPEQTLKDAGILSENVKIERVPCTGRLEVQMLLDAFEQGAEAVFVAGCKIDECHNQSGSLRASKRVRYVKQILEELDIDPGRVEMFFVNRGETEPVVEAVREMEKRISSMEALHG